AVDSACGTAGVVCQTCGATQACQLGFCATRSQCKGAGSNCLGNGECCSANCSGGLCSNGAGGGGGGLSCAATCAGCCDSTGACQAGTAAQTCGKGGASCSVCQSTQSCVTQVCRDVA